jgi:ubiquinone/menaquinone biosynthesis C-methylase UbiE
MDELNPQAQQMADESMVRCLSAQADAIWPQESALLRRYALPSAPQILDAGCGTGEAAWRLCELFPQSQVLGVDIVDAHLQLARSRHARLGERLRFEHQSVFELALPDASFDLTLCRHVMHALPQAARVLAELRRVTRSGGYLHLIAEDYGMLHFQGATPDAREFWQVAAPNFGRATGTDLFIGRNIHGLLAAMDLEQIAIDYVVVDTLRVPRATFADILRSWRDGYSEAIGEPTAYAVWMVPVVSARVR